MDKLTPNGISMLIENMPCVLQITHITTPGKFNIAIFSDGTYFLKNVVISDSAMKKIGKPAEALLFAIVKILKSGPVKNTQHIKIDDAELVSGAYKTQLGNIVPYEQSFNKNGNIPHFGENSKGVSMDSKGEVKKPEPQKAIKKATEVKPQEESKSNSNLQPPAGKDKKQVLKQQTLVVTKSRDSSSNKPAIDQKQQRNVSNPPIAKVSPFKKEPKPSQSYEGISDISDLYTGMENWTIRVRVIFKSEIKKIRTKKNNQDMDIVNFTFIDRQNTLLPAVAFNQMAQKYHSCIQLNFVYDVSHAQVVPETHPKNGVTVNIKLTLTQKCILNEAIDDNRIATIEDRCCSLQEYIEKPIGSVCSIICMVKQAEEVEEFISKAGKQCIKRLVTICDPVERVQLQITMWGDMAHYVFEHIPYIITDMAVKEFKGMKQYSTGFECAIMPLKDHKFRRFKDLSVIDFVNKSVGGTTKNSRTTFQEMSSRVDAIGGQNDKIWSEVKCFIVNVRTSGTMWYLSCPNLSCKKKVSEETNSICPHCNTQYDNGKYRYILGAEFSDTTSSIWATMYDDLAERVLDGATADQLQKMDLDEVKQVCSLSKGKQLIALFSSKQQTYQGGIHAKHSLSKILQFDVIKETQNMMKGVMDYLTI